MPHLAPTKRGKKTTRTHVLFCTPNITDCCERERSLSASGKPTLDRPLRRGSALGNDKSGIQSASCQMGIETSLLADKAAGAPS